MTRRFSASVLAFLIAVAIWLPLAGLEEACGDCGSGCCTPACSLCFCCGPGRTVLSGALQVDREPGLASTFNDAAGGDALSSDPRDVFHVPKTFLI
jgi:hypothetical protein